MITDAVLDWAFGVLAWLVSLVPNDVTTMDGLEQPSGWLTWWNGMWYFLPMSTLLACVGFIVSVHIFMNNVWVVNWIIKRVRGG